MPLQIHDVEQGSDEWIAARCGLLTASVIGQFITPKTVKPAANDKTRAMAYQLVAERITGIVEDRYVSRDMAAGHFIEPLARDYYTEHVEPVTECGFITNEIAGHKVGFSPDGLVGLDGLIEIKLHVPKLHLATILGDVVPAEHYAQCQMGLIVSERAWLDYVAYCPGWPVFIRRVLPNPQWVEAITETVAAFEESAATMLGIYQRSVAGLPVTERITFPWDLEIEINE
jgi:hypothetical protein